MKIPGQYLQMLAGKFVLICTLITSTVFKCERRHYGTRSEGEYEETQDRRVNDHIASSPYLENIRIDIDTMGPLISTQRDQIAHRQVKI